MSELHLLAVDNYATLKPAIMEELDATWEAACDKLDLTSEGVRIRENETLVRIEFRWIGENGDDKSFSLFHSRKFAGRIRSAIGFATAITPLATRVADERSASGLTRAEAQDAIDAAATEAGAEPCIVVFATIDGRSRWLHARSTSTLAELAKSLTSDAWHAWDAGYLKAYDTNGNQIVNSGSKAYEWSTVPQPLLFFSDSRNPKL